MLLKIQIDNIICYCLLSAYFMLYRCTAVSVIGQHAYKITVIIIIMYSLMLLNA